MGPVFFSMFHLILFYFDAVFSDSKTLFSDGTRVEFNIGVAPSCRTRRDANGAPAYSSNEHIKHYL